MDSRRPLKCHSEILQTPPVYAKPQCTSWPLIHALTTEVYGTDKDRFAAVYIFYAIIVVEHLNNSCKCCWNNCFSVINLSVNYSLLGPLLYIAFCAQAWNVRKPYRNTLLSTQGMTTVCSVTADHPSRSPQAYRTSSLLSIYCHWAAFINKQRAGGSAISYQRSRSTGPLMSLSQCPSTQPHPQHISWFIAQEAQAWRYANEPPW